MAYDPWINCGVEGWAKWPRDPTTIEFDGRDLHLLPPDSEHFASVHIQIERSRTGEECGYTTINRYLSMRSWSEDQPIGVRFSWLGSAHPVPVPRGAISQQIVEFAPHNQNSPDDPKHRLALALFREARTMRSVPYAFLGYFKILNIFWNDKVRNGKNPLVEGIRGSLQKISAGLAAERLQALSVNEPDVAMYLYKMGRCAIAHAYTQPVVDPDAAADTRRLAKDLILIKAVAELQIERQFSVSRSAQRY